MQAEPKPNVNFEREVLKRQLVGCWGKSLKERLRGGRSQRKAKRGKKSGGRRGQRRERPGKKSEV